MKKIRSDRPVTESVLRKNLQRVDDRFETLDKKIDDRFSFLDHKIDRVALGLVRTDERLERLEQTVATKTDVQLILSRIDHFTKRLSINDQEQGIQGVHMIELRQKVDDHEKRLTALEDR